MNVRHWFTRLRIGALVLTAAASLISASSASAALLAYEPFNYPSGAPIFTGTGNVTATVASGGGDFGWTEPWRSNNTNAMTATTVVAGSLGYSVGGRTLVTAGNTFWASGNPTATGDNFSAAGSTGGASPFRRIAFANQRGYSANANSTTWISFLGKSVNLPTVTYTGTAADGGSIVRGRAQGPVQLFNAAADNVDPPANTTAGTEMLSFGRASQDSETTDGAAASPSLGLPNDTWGTLVGGTGRGTVASSTPLGDLVMYLVKINHVAGVAAGTADDDSVEVWINPASLTNEGLLGAPTLTLTPAQFNGLPPANPTGRGLNNANDLNFNRIRIFAGGNNTTVGYGSVLTDEIRIGESFDDVTPDVGVPEPGSFALAAMGLAAFAAIRRKA
jgi:hypothetical protein